MRAHNGRWDSEETLKTLQSRDYFKEFSKAVQGFAGDTIDAKQVGLYRETG
jgi:hypothetical protein